MAPSPLYLFAHGKADEETEGKPYKNGHRPVQANPFGRTGQGKVMGKTRADNLSKARHGHPRKTNAPVMAKKPRKKRTIGADPARGLNSLKA
jgi:hypothetical protein